MQDAITWAENTSRQFEVSGDVIQRATDHFVHQLREGLQKDGTDLLQVPSYVVKLPTGAEKGVYLAVDLGGTNLRVCSVELHGDSTHSVVQSKVAIPHNVMTADTYKDLFRFVAQHTESFMLKHLPADVKFWREEAALGESAAGQLQNRHVHSLGFTFSFTFDQSAIDRGTLLFWTKAFRVDDAIGRDPCQMLQEAFDEYRLPLVVRALVNDTVGTLAARAYASGGASKTLLAAIFGTGTNGAYMERVSRIKKLPAQGTCSPGDSMALNTEWGGFDKDLNVLPKTVFDQELDRDSVNPNDQHYEKRISGLYLGELLRRVLLADLQSTTPILTFKADSDSNLYTAYSIDSSFLSGLAQDSSPELQAARSKIAQDLKTTAVSVDEARAIRNVAIAIGRRASRLSAIAIAGVVIQSERLAEPVAKTAVSNARPATIWKRCFARLQRLFVSLKGLCGIQNRSSQEALAPKDAQFMDSDASSTENPVLEDEGIIDIGVDGSLFEFLPGFEMELRSALREISQIGPSGETKIRFGAVADGSGIGAALIVSAL